MRDDDECMEDRTQAGLECPKGCRTYLVQEVLAPHVSSLRCSLLLRFVGFFRGLLQSPSHEVTAIALLAARDIRSNLGANLKLVQEKSKLDLWMARMDQLLGALEAADRVEVPPAGQLAARLPQEAPGPATAGPLQG